MKRENKFLVKNAGLFLGLILTAIIFYFDYITGPYLGLSLFYIGAVSFSTWTGGLGNGLIIAFISAGCWLSADLISGANYPSILFPFWNAGIRLFIFVIIAYFIWKIEVAKKMRKDFFNFVIHDLRNPLFSILLVADNMRKHSVYAVDDAFKEKVEDTVFLAKQMASFVDVILDLTRLENKAVILKFSDIDVKGLTQTAQRQVAVFADKAEISLETQIGTGMPNIKTDYNMALRVLVNLLANAIKASPRGGAVTIRVEAVDKKRLAFSVIDQGYGIPKHVSRVIFNQFVTTKEKEFGMSRGFGLGLTFCKLAVEKLGGRIAVSSSQGKGTVFTFTLPLKAKNVAK